MVCVTHSPFCPRPEQSVIVARSLWPDGSSERLGELTVTALSGSSVALLDEVPHAVRSRKPSLRSETDSPVTVSFKMMPMDRNVSRPVFLMRISVHHSPAQ